MAYYPVYRVPCTEIKKIHSLKDSTKKLHHHQSTIHNPKYIMRNLFLLLVTVLLFSNCSVHQGLTSNLNNHTTGVVLSQNNFTVIQNVQGEAKGTSFFGIGGAKNALIAEAKAQMLSRADIIGKPRAIVNETVEINRSFFPIVRVLKVTVSGHIIEFTE